MPVQMILLKNQYRDSVSLMQMSAKLAQSAGVAQFSAVMATPANQDLLLAAGLLQAQVEAGPNDLLLVAEAETDAAAEAVLAEAQALLQQKPAAQSGDRQELPPRSTSMALAGNFADANLALISVPGAHAASEALKALRLGCNVMIFSDNVSVEDERMLKEEAHARGLLVMGPDCGTALVGGVPLAFANVTPRGPIGIVGASGTGIQHVCCHLAALGGGVSHAIGTGGRDNKEAIGGITTLDALDLLDADESTTVAMIISKPPAASVSQRLLQKASAMHKPVVALLLGADTSAPMPPNVHAVGTMEEAALKAMELAGLPLVAAAAETTADAAPLPNWKPEQWALRGLFSGGTLCGEAAMLLGRELPEVRSNTPGPDGLSLEDPWKSIGHSLVDMGDDEFTRGRPHPMIDQRLRCERMVQEAHDPTTAVILLDVVLGYGSNPDPAADLVRTMEEARAVAATTGRELAFVAYICGTNGDPQSLTRQTEALRAAGVHLAPTNAAAARLALDMLRRAGKA